jgi:hypothetical protein
MRPSRGLAARRKIAHHDATKNFHRVASSNERLSGDDYSGSLANHVGLTPIV